MKQYYFLALLLLTTSSLLTAQEIVINEIQAKNLSTYKNPKTGEYSDWIELKNTTSSSIDLSGYFLTDDKENLKKWTIPSGTKILANGFLLIIADNTNSGLSTNFKLSTTGEEIILSKKDGSEIHKIEYPLIQNDVSYGRLVDGSYSFMNKPTPSSENTDSSAFTLLDSDIKINIPTGLYSANQTIEITKKGEGKLYYTLNGTKPSLSSILYSGPITIDKNTVLKTIVIKSLTEYSSIENRSYIIGATHNLPVVLLTSDNSYLNSNKKEVIDGRVQFNFIEKDGTVAINQYANFRESGRTSRNQPQLNGKVEADGVYGDDDFDYKMYPNKKTDEFESFLLRNASQDWSETHMRDAFIARLLGQDNLADFPFEGYRPAVLYVNAKYQGIINVREDDDNDYVKHNYDLKKGEFKKNGRDWIPYTFTTDREKFDKILNFNDHVNAQFLISYAELNEYGFGSWKDLSGKTAHENHYFMHDYDATFGLLGEDHVPLTGPMPVSSIIPSEMKAHEAYKTEAIQFISATINHIYNKDRAITILNKMEEELESEIPAHAIINSKLAVDQGYNKYNKPPFANLTEWKNNVEALRKDIKGRFDSTIFNRIKNEYSLEDPILVTYESSDITKGIIRVHNVKSVKETFTGTYFKNIPIHFSAEALPGYKFVRWEGDFTSTDLNISPVFSTNSRIKAVFEPVTSSPTNLVINEVQGKNDTTIADEKGEFDDWIEIYNPNDKPVNLAGYYVSDNPSEPLKWKIPNTNVSKTTIKAKGFLLLWADKDVDQGENHLGFKLKGTDQVILTAPDATKKIQEISFTAIDTDFSYGAKVDASTEYVVFTKPTPGVSNNSVLSTEDFEGITSKIEIYPNPTIDVITIKGISEKLNWKLYDITGKKIRKGIKKVIQLNDLEKGLYVLIINDKTSLKVLKK